MRLSDLAMAPISRPSKKQAFTALRDLIQGMNEADVDSASFELAALYKFFAPKKRAKPNTPEKWVSEAAAWPKDAINPCMGFVYSTGKELVATDGARLHLLKTDSYPAGYYDRDLAPVDDKGKYPLFERAMVDKSKSDHVTMTKTKILSGKVTTLSDGGKMIKCMGENLNEIYLSRALSLFSDYDIVEVYHVPGILKPVQFELGDCTALVMAMNG